MSLKNKIVDIMFKYPLLVGMTALCILRELALVKYQRKRYGHTVKELRDYGNKKRRVVFVDLKGEC